MKRIIALMALSCASAFATVVSATITGPDGAAYVNGKYEARLANGSTSRLYTGSLDSSGTFSLTLSDNATVGGKWLFTICSAPLQTTGQRACFSSAQAISGSTQSLTSSLSALALGTAPDPVTPDQYATKYYVDNHASSTSPGSPDHSVQTNQGGAFTGSSFLSTNETTKTLGLGGNVTISNVAVPAAPSAALAGAGAGNLPNIQLSYVQTWLTASGESAPSALSNNVTVADHTANGKVIVTLDTTGPTGSTGKNLYRSVVIAAVNNSGCPGDGIDNCEWKKVNSSPIAIATASFTDNVANGSLGAVVPGYDSTAGVITDTVGQVLARDASGNNYVRSTVFLSPGYDNEGRFWFGPSPVIPITASAAIMGGGASGGMSFDAVGNVGDATEKHYLAFGADTTHPLVGVTACDTDLNGCGSPGQGSATPVILYAINSDFGPNQFQLSSIGGAGENDAEINYLLALNDPSQLGVIEAANHDSGVHQALIQKPNFVARKSTGQTEPLFEGVDVNGTTQLPFEVNSDGNLQLNGRTLAQITLLTLTDGTEGYCSDCTVTSGSDNTCAGSGSGAKWIRIAGATRCFKAQN